MVERFDVTLRWPAALRETESALNVYVHDLQREQRAKAARDDAAQAADRRVRG